MKILITGGAGFIASHVSDRYIAAGHEVVVVDSLVTGKPENLNPAARFVKLDIRRHEEVTALLNRERFAVINHHAAQMDVRKSTEDPLYDAEVNIVASLNLIQAAARCGVGKFIYISTGGAVYGEPKRLPVLEDDPVNPECQYGISKHTVEHYLYLYQLQHKLPYTVLRYPNVYGPRQNPHGEAGVIAIFAELMLQGKPVTIYGDGQQLRDYVFVADVAEANVLALKQGANEIINLGSERGTSVLELFQQLKPLTGYQPEPRFAPPRLGEIQKIFLTGQKAEKLLGWRARVAVNEGLRQTVEWVRRVRATGTWR